MHGPGAPRGQVGHSLTLVVRGAARLLAMALMILGALLFGRGVLLVLQGLFLPVSLTAALPAGGILAAGGAAMGGLGWAVVRLIARR